MTKVMKTGELVTKLAENMGTTKKEARETLDVVFKTLEDSLFAEQEGFKLGGIGTFKVEVLAEREYPVPNSDEKVTKPERYGVKFKVNSAFRKDLEQVKVK